MTRRNWRRILQTVKARTEAALRAAPRPEDAALEAGLKALSLEELREFRDIRKKVNAARPFKSHGEPPLSRHELERGYILMLKIETAAAAKYPGKSSFTPEGVAAAWLEYACPPGPLPPLPPPTRETPQPTEHP